MSENGGMQSSVTPMVSVQSVHKRFGDLEVLRGISMSVQKGQTFVISGLSGSGKSTLLRVINHLEKVDSGRIYVDGHLLGYREVNGKLKELPERQIARQRQEIGMVFQRFNL